jgi:hypothetical protein
MPLSLLLRGLTTIREVSPRPGDICVNRFSMPEVYLGGSWPVFRRETQQYDNPPAIGYDLDLDGPVTSLSDREIIIASIADTTASLLSNFTHPLLYVYLNLR